jgi:hypothetical protein
MYSLHGLRIRSDLALGTPAAADGPIDLELTLAAAAGAVSEEPPPGEVIAQLLLGGRRFYVGTDQEARYVLRIPEVCDFVVDRSLAAVECRPAPSAQPEVLALLVRGALLAFILGLGGACVLHASVVETDGGSVAFVGGSGMGKSTMAALACRDGARFVSDDLLRLGADPPPSWVGCSAELRLRPVAAALAGGREIEWAARETIDDRVAVRPPGPRGSSGPIGAVVVPAPTRTEPDLTLDRIEPVEAAFVLSAFPRLMWTSPAVLATQFDGVSRLADGVPVYRASVPWGPPFADGLGSRITSQALGG